MDARQLLARVRHFGYHGFPRLMSEVRKRWIVWRHPDATIRFGKGVFAGPGFGVYIPANGTLIVGDGVEFRRNCRIEISGDGKIVIGNGSYLTYGVLIACSTEIVIGERCGIGFNCSVYDGNHRYRDLSRPFLEQGYEFRNVHIEDDAQIHSTCTIINSIGHRAVIGANSVVTKPIPPYTLAVGAPAHPIDYFGPDAERAA